MRASVAFALGLLVCTAGAFPAQEGAKAVLDRHVEVSFDQLACGMPTDGQNEDDEVYMYVTGDTPAGVFHERLPRHVDDGDYYRFMAHRRFTGESGCHWMNRDHGDVGPPVFWHGTLKNGQQAAFRVFVLEQDNRDWGQVKKALEDALPKAAGAAAAKLPKIAAVISGANLALPLIPAVTAHDMLGVFAVVVTNNNGKIATEWVAPKTVDLPKFNDVNMAVEVELDPTSPRAKELVRSHQAVAAARVEFRATSGGHYIGVLKVRDTPQPAPKALRTIGHTREKCDAQPLRVLHGDKNLIHLDDSVILRDLGKADKLMWQSENPKAPWVVNIIRPNGWNQPPALIPFPTNGTFELAKGTTAVSVHRPPKGVVSSGNECGTIFIATQFQEEEYGKRKQP